MKRKAGASSKGENGGPSKKPKICMEASPFEPSASPLSLEQRTDLGFDQLQRSRTMKLKSGFERAFSKRTS